MRFLRHLHKAKSAELMSLADYVAEAAPDAMRWTQPGLDGLRVASIPSWTKACARRYREEREQNALVELGGEA